MSYCFRSAILHGQFHVHTELIDRVEISDRFMCFFNWVLLAVTVPIFQGWEFAHSLISLKSNEQL